MGAGSMDYRQLAQQMESHTGGIEFSPTSHPHHSDLSKFKAGIYISSYCLDKNLDRMFELLHMVLSDPKFDDVERLKSIIFGNTSDIQESIVESGHAYARTLAASVFSRAHALQESWSGISQVSLMQQLAQTEDFSSVIANLKKIAQHVLDASLMRFSLVAEEPSLPKAEQRLNHLLESMRASQDHSGHDEYRDSEYQSLLRDHRLFVPIPAQVNFVCKVLPTVPYTHPDFPRLKTLASLLSSLFLHSEIREKGGAYGGGALSLEGLWSFYSFRDPNTTKTLDVYSSVLQWLRNEPSFLNQDIDEAKLRLFSSIDHPVAPSRQGSLEFMSGITWDMRQRNRERILDTTRRDLIDVAERYLLSHSDSKDNKPVHASVAIFGSALHNPFTPEETLHLDVLSRDDPQEGDGDVKPSTCMP